VTEFPSAEELIAAADVDAGFDRLAASLQPVIDSDPCLLLGVLTGGMYPLIRLAERLQGDFLLDYCHATRYAGGTEGHELIWEAMPHFDLAGHTVVVVDDIYDAGLTMQAVADHCRQNGAARVLTAVMLIKDRDRSADLVLPDYDAGLRVPDRYVFGCGMDLHGRWRHLPAIYALAADPEV
jgi:hypoxanthine phosphoribosyltransferase